jgi:hypothetical protein
LAEPRAPQGEVGRRRGPGEHAQRNFRSIAVERKPGVAAAAVDNRNHVAGVGLGLDDVGLVDPRVTVVNPLLAALGDGDRCHTL